MVVISTMRISIENEKRQELYQTILPLLEPIRHEKGCLTCNLYLDAKNHNESLLLGEWESTADWNRHVQSHHFAILSGAISVLGGPAILESQLFTAV